MLLTLNLFFSPHNSHTLTFERGDLTSPNVITMSEYRNASAAVADVAGLANEGELINTPSNLASPYVSVMPHGQFEGANGMATISIKLNSGSSGATIRRANPNSAWVFVPLDTQIVDGQAMAQTNQGGIFVAGSGFNYGLVVGASVAGVVVLLVILIVVATVVYFVVKPEKWRKTKENVAKTQMKMKRSFAKQV